MIPAHIDKSKIPHKPGIYIYKDEKGQVLYIGKAIDLYSRVSSYFNNHQHETKTAQLVLRIFDLETIIVESELEALVLEANLIKKYLPPYNLRLTDDKDYLYIAISKEEFPKVYTARKKDIEGAKNYFGPFPSSQTVKATLKKLRRVFPWCSNPPGSRNKLNRPCFYYHLRLCPGACVGKITSKDYKKIISRFVKFLEGRKEELVDELSSEMGRSAQKLEFEKADQIKKILGGVEYLTQPNRVANYLDNPNFLEDERAKALEDLQKKLVLEKTPDRIEAYDISNIQGQDATGSMVVLTFGEIDKSQYRRFKIKISGRPNDYAMHAEMMRRRLKNRTWPLPDLILIDGGRGQVRAVQEELKKVSVDIPILGLAKREEWLYPSEGDVIKLERSSLGLRLLQKIRDESHRFAVSYHRKLHKKSVIPTAG